ncbi:zinc metalloprotease [Chitinophaga nivalis]|uniref:Zinc metalloprotease n=1 Tax=Chitinophaga nivalis TaxID=2991709 RepID=A0ABT3ISA8_9BACT|nr:zinc metalloprotease [Chitinophaga nivalis]MCW3463447.1 zinc metalloprotease [Chitinophaga nivalis]MCW3486863.1 zinc metalloprotease [Chitinophaga nivalis]
MKKIAHLLFIGALCLSACSKQDKSNTDQPSPDSNQEAPAGKVRRCATGEVLKQQLLDDPTLAQRMQNIEKLTEEVTRNRALFRLLPDGSIEIPVVVNILYRTTAQNVALSQVESQITALNQDFNGLNSQYNTLPPIFDAVKAAVGVHFRLKNVVRKSTTVTTWGTNDAMKKSSQGGINPTTPDSVLNIWVVGGISGGVIGYAQFPGGSPATDGVVIAYDCFGTNGTAAAPFALGRTATHEVGHWLNLRHIWGDANCGDDLVGDTPRHNTANYGCPAYPHRSTCTGTPIEMTMNFMDYTDDACMAMFTQGQKTRIDATFLPGGGRNGFAH